MSLHLTAQHAEVQRKTDSLLQALNTQRIFSGSIACYKNKELVCSATADHLSNGSGVYKVGSVTKVYTAIIIYQLIEKGLLQLDTKLSQFFPNLPHADKITIQQMLGHTSGLYNITEWESYYGTRTKQYSRQEFIDIVRKQKPEFKPGKDCTYSNTNFILLGYIAEDLTKKPFAQLIDEQIAQPASLTSTYFETSGVPHPKRESSYLYDGEKWFPDVDSDASLPHAAGALVSTPKDLCATFHALFNHQLISDSAMRVMQKLNDRSTGHGIFKGQFNKKTSWMHSGRIDEFSAVVLTIPEDSLHLAIVTNGTYVEINDIIIHVLSAYYNKPFVFKTPEQTAAVSQPATSIYTGLYRAKLFGFIPLGKMLVTEAGAHCLFLEEGDGSCVAQKSLLIRKDATTFYSSEAEATVTFESNAKGIVKRCFFRTSGITIKCKKLR